MIHIDPHVHCRDWDQSYKGSTIGSTTALAREQGVQVIFDMPNTIPDVLRGVDVKRRFDTADEQGCLEGYYTYIKLTKDRDQVMEAAQVAKDHPRVVGLKMYSDSVISDEKSQLMILKWLYKEGYDGVLSVHAEKRSLFNEDLWDPNYPLTWNLVRPIESEVHSIKDHIRFAKESRFEGKLYFVHVTSPKAVDIIREAKKHQEVYCAVTPQHTTLSTLNMRTRSGLMFKVNSPLRDYLTMRHLRQYVINGLVDTIESDNAPHTLKEKMYYPYCSGIQSLRFYNYYLNDLIREGATESLINQLTYKNIINIFEKVRV